MRGDVDADNSTVDGAIVPRCPNVGGGVPLAALSPSIRIRAEVAGERMTALLVSGQDQLSAHAACHRWSR
jgi:hypothetical protein